MSQKIAIIGGCGHVGLPLGIAFASKPGFEVHLVDINEWAVRSVNQGKMLFVEEGGEPALRTVVGKSLFATTDPSVVKEANVVVIVTGTPVDEHLNPRIQDVTRVLDQYMPYFKTGQLLVLRSTLYPGVSELVWKYVSQKRFKQLGVAFCPERVAQGHALEEIETMPQIVSAFDPQAEDQAAELFKNICPEVLRLMPREAELMKLFANGWRYIEFAIANQFYMIAQSHGVDFHRVFSALSHNYPRAKHFAKPGFSAGPCLFKDTMQLSAFFNNQCFLGHSAMLVNEGLPNFVVEQLKQKMGGSLEGKKIGLLGMAFKPNHDDTRESLAYKTKKILITELAEVLETDVFQPTASKLPEILHIADGLILGVPHNEYLSLAASGALKGKAFVDCWGVWQKPDLEVSPFAAKPSTARVENVRTAAAPNLAINH